MTFHRTQIAAAATLLCLSLSPSLIPNAAAQQSDGKTKQATPPPKEEMTKVEIKGEASDYDPRRDDTASKTVITPEEILKYGDTNVYDVLKRAPGVTVIGNSIRMRGLGNGYTQILVNGESPPPGFSMDALVPEQIERIEIIRSATAELSMRAIAGSINIVLKKLVAKPQRDLRLNGNHSGQNDAESLFGTVADRTGKLSYYLNAFLSHSTSKSPSASTEQFALPSGQVVQLRDIATTSKGENSSIALIPRLNWKLDDEGQLNWSGFVNAWRGNNDGESDNTNRIGVFPAPDYVRHDSHGESRGGFYGTDLNWVTKLTGGKLDAKVSTSRGGFDSDSRRLSSTIDDAPALLRILNSTSHYTNFSSTGKYARSMFEGHSLAAGWEANYQKSEEDRLRLEGLTSDIPVRIDEVFKPAVTRMAAFAQDEWNVTKLWSMYLGARWEGIRTESAGTGLQTTNSRSHVLSPVAQTLYKFPDKSGRQLRLALTRTYKAPTIDQLTARRIDADLNTRFTPDSSGNPNLQPELATGIDLTYEHFWAPGAVFSVSTSSRHITNYIRTTLAQDVNGYWLYQPVNDGSVQVRSLDTELKFPLKTLWKEAPAIDLRASINRNWSQVASVPGPDNRLDQQVPVSAVFGADYKIDKYGMGANFAFRSGGTVRISEQQSTQLQPRRDLDAYLLYKFTPAVQLRFAANNLLAQDNRNVSRYQDISGTSQTWSSSPNSRRWQVNLEMKL